MLMSQLKENMRTLFDLGAIESSITRVQFPWFPKLIQTVLQLLPGAKNRSTYN